MTHRKWFAILFISNAVFFGWGYFWGRGHAPDEIAMTYGTGTTCTITAAQLADTTSTFACFSGPPDHLVKLPKATSSSSEPKVSGSP